MNDHLIGRHCKECKTYQCLDHLASDQFLKCPKCNAEWGKIHNIDDIFECCPICACRQFYLSKDFNQFLGCLIMALGIIFVPLTYGLSLPVFALIDWILYKKVKTIVNCYRCGTEFHDFTYPEHLKPFMHHIGLKYDKYRN